MVSRDKVTWVHYSLLKGTRKKKKSPRRGRRKIVIKGERNELGQTIVEWVNKSKCSFLKLSVSYTVP